MIFNCIGGGGGSASQLKFQSWYGTAPDPVKAKYQQPEQPSQTGYVFGGWYVDQMYKTPYDWDADAKAGTVYAKWAIEQPTVTPGTPGQYDGTPKVLGTVTAKGEGQTVEYSLDGETWGATAPTATAAGTYTVSWRVTADHVEPLTGSFDVEIAGASMTVRATDKSATYDGSAVTANPVTVTVPATGYTLRYGTTAGTYDLEQPPSFTDAGEHIVYYRVTAESYATATGSYRVTIAKASANLTVSPTSLTVKEADGGTGTITATRSGDGAVTATSSATGKATVSVSGTTVTVRYVDAGEATVTVSVAETANYLGASDEVTVTLQSALKIVTWAGGSDAEVAAMVAAADAGTIKLSDYWKVGDTRTVSLSAMSATGVGESHAAQTAEFVLMNVGGKTLANGKACSFVVGMKDCLKETGYMNASNKNNGGWEASARRTWCNATFRNAIPSGLRGIFKQHRNVTANGSSSSTATSTDYFALPSEKEVFGSTTYSNATAEASNSQFEWYNTANNSKKTMNGGSSWWWERSPRSGNSNLFCAVSTGGTAGSRNASNTYGLSPFGCI